MMADRPGRRRRVQKKWMLRIADSKRATDTRCALCNMRAPLVPITSRVSEPGFVEHIWRCSACGNQWTTSTKAPP
jgi:hypothetical protein